MSGFYVDIDAEELRRSVTAAIEPVAIAALEKASLSELVDREVVKLLQTKPGMCGAERVLTLIVQCEFTELVREIVKQRLACQRAEIEKALQDVAVASANELTKAVVATFDTAFTQGRIELDLIIKTRDVPSQLYDEVFSREED